MHRVDDSGTAYPVALARCASYASAAVHRTVCSTLEATGWKPQGSRILVKPNLLRAHGLACTHPEVVKAVCVWLLEQGARVTVGDSPGFGRAGRIAEQIGLAEALRPLGLGVVQLENPVSVALPGGGRWGVARLALESDAIVSVPKVKAHSQMRLTLGVKNLFGCVCGLRKALAHADQGRDRERFADCLAFLWTALPPVAGLADGVEAMHVTGPAGGQPFELGLIAASGDVGALDTALYGLLGSGEAGKPGPDIPLWQALRRRRAPQADPDTLTYPLAGPSDFSIDGFVLPAELRHTSFRPGRLLGSVARRMWLSLRR